MAESKRPLGKATAPDPATVYERAKPAAEAGMGRLDNNAATPVNSDDKMEQTVTHRQPPRQLNADDVVDERQGHRPGEAPQERRP
jgi:hypothetical protein